MTRRRPTVAQPYRLQALRRSSKYRSSLLRSGTDTTIRLIAHQDIVQYHTAFSSTVLHNFTESQPNHDSMLPSRDGMPRPAPRRPAARSVMSGGARPAAPIRPLDERPDRTLAGRAACVLYSGGATGLPGRFSSAAPRDQPQRRLRHGPDAAESRSLRAWRGAAPSAVAGT